MSLNRGGVFEKKGVWNPWSELNWAIFAKFVNYFQSCGNYYKSGGLLRLISSLGDFEDRLAGNFLFQKNWSKTQQPFSLCEVRSKPGARSHNAAWRSPNIGSISCFHCEATKPAGNSVHLGIYTGLKSWSVQFCHSLEAAGLILWLFAR